MERGNKVFFLHKWGICKQNEEMRIFKINEEYAKRKSKLDEYRTLLRILYKWRIVKQYKNYYF